MPGRSGQNFVDDGAPPDRFVWVFAPASRDGDRDIEMSRHERVDFSCRDISFGRISVHPFAAEATLPRRHHHEITTVGSYASV